MLDDQLMSRMFGLLQKVAKTNLFVFATFISFATFIIFASFLWFSCN